MLPPPGMERANPSAYVLPGLPAPVTSWPPAPPADSAPAPEDGSEGASKRQRTEPSSVSTAAPPAARPKFAPAPPRAPPPSSVGLLAGLSAYGDDDDDEEEQPAVAFETHAKRAQPAKKAAGSQYPSMNPARMGASV